MMLRFLPKFLLAVFSTLVFQKLEAQTETEPNNTPATANTLPLNGSLKGAINPAGDVDFFKVTTTSDGQLNIALTPLSGKYMWVYIFDHNGVIQLNSGNSNGAFTVSVDGLAAGTYYVQVNTYYSSDTSSYTISSSLTAVAQPNDLEPDSTRALALTLAPNSSTTGHIDYYYNNHRDSADWYKITTTGDGLLKLTLTSYNGQYVWAYLYDNDGVTQLNSVNTNGTVDVSTDGLAAGTYYVRINTYYNTGFAPYKLADTLYKPAQPNDAEPDSTKAQALTLAQNSSATGHINYYYNNHRDTSDWYKITTNGDGLLKLTLSSFNGQYVWAYLYDNDGVTQLNAQNTNGTLDITTDGLAAGTYYVRVNSYYNTGFVPYKLADTLYTPAQAGDKEPNDTKATADTLKVNTSVTGHTDYYYNNHRDSADWYKIILPKDGDLRLRLTSGNGQFVWAYLYDNDGVTQLNAQYTSGTLDITTDGLGAGTYYVRVNSYYNNGYVPYTLADSLFLYNSPNDTIPNQYFSQAPTILSNRVTGGHIGFYYNLMRDTIDNFKINYTGTSGNLNLTFRLEPHISDGSVNYTWFQVYKDTSATPIYNNYFTSTSTQVNLTGLSQGYYYVRVFEYYNSQSQAYSIADSFIQVNKALISINTSKTTINSSTCGADSITYNLSGSHSPYTVRLYKNAALYDSIITTGTTATFKALSAGNYYATVYGDGATDSAYSKSVTSTATPPVPTALTTTGIGVHTATLNWTKLSCANYYKVQYRAVGSPTWIVINTTGDTSKLALTGLQPYTLYAWQVASVDTTKGATFTSAFADSVTFRTLSDTAHIALTFKGAGAACNSDTLTYTATNSAAPYTVTLYRNGVAYGSPLSVASIASFYNVPPGNYYATATGTGSGGSYGRSDTTQIAPPAPTGLDTITVTATTAMLNWNATGCANYYTVQYKKTGTTTWTSVNIATNNVLLTGLMADTKYTWQVSASDSFNRQTVISAYSDTATFVTLSTLPVTFINFNGALQNNEVVLNWSTANELNNKGYQVERSSDNIHFASIGFVASTSGTSVHQYGYVDNKLTGGSMYYRLKQIDLDGNYHYSNVIKIDFSKFAWYVSGNPVSNSSNSSVQLILDHKASVSLQVVSLNGSIMQIIQKGTLNAGSYTIPLTLNNAAAGTYIVKLMVDKDSYTSKILKQ